jgi:hypothetical protein
LRLETASSLVSMSVRQLIFDRLFQNQLFVVSAF